MKNFILDMDKIQFCDRYAMDEVISALETFLEEHPEAKEVETVTEFKDLLDALYMSW